MIRVDKEALWSAIQMYGIEGTLLAAAKSFYKNNRACVRDGKGESD